MTAQPGHFLAGKRVIVAGGGFTGHYPRPAMTTLDSRPSEVILYEQDGRDESIRKEPLYAVY